MKRINLFEEKTCDNLSTYMQAEQEKHKKLMSVGKFVLREQQVHRQLLKKLKS